MSLKAATGDEAFTCPECKQVAGTKVIDSRGVPSKDAIRRRRQCLNHKCRKRFSTYEVTESIYEKTIVRDRAFTKWMSGLMKLVEECK